MDPKWDSVMKFCRVYIKFFKSGLCELHMRNNFVHMRITFISGKSRLHEYFEGKTIFCFRFLDRLLKPKWNQHRNNFIVL